MKKLDKKVIVGMSQELYDRLKELAEEDFRSVPSCIRMILKEYVEKTDEKTPVPRRERPLWKGAPGEAGWGLCSRSEHTK